MDIPKWTYPEEESKGDQGKEKKKIYYQRRYEADGKNIPGRKAWKKANHRTVVEKGGDSGL